MWLHESVAGLHKTDPIRPLQVFIHPGKAPVMMDD